MDYCIIQSHFNIPWRKTSLVKPLLPSRPSPNTQEWEAAGTRDNACRSPISAQAAPPLNHLPWCVGIWATLRASPAVVSSVIRGVSFEKGHHLQWILCVSRQLLIHQSLPSAWSGPEQSCPCDPIFRPCRHLPREAAAGVRGGVGVQSTALACSLPV